MSLRVWGSPHELCFSPLQAESAALLWAVRLAAQENWHQVVFEGVTKASVFDSLGSLDFIPDWSINLHQIGRAHV